MALISPLTSPEISDEDITDRRYQEIPVKALHQICNFATFNQLKILRLVCRHWNIQVSSHRRIENCTGVLRKDWIDKARGLEIEGTLKWSSVYFYFFPFNKNAVFPLYWEYAGQNVTRVQFAYTKISCNRMVAFLTSMPHLTDVSFRQCNFELIRRELTDVDRQGRKKALKCACPHARLELPAGLVMPPPRIRRIVLFKEDYFPLCLFDLLEARSAGVLEEIRFDHNRLARWRRRYYLPTPDQVEGKLFDIIVRNWGTIRTFSFFRNYRGDIFLDRLRNRNPNNPNPPSPIEVLSLGQQASWLHMQTAGSFIAYLNYLDNTRLKEVTWRFIHRFDSLPLANALARHTQLTYLFIDTVWCQNADNAENQLNFAPILQQLTKLETLHVRDRNRRRRPSQNTSYLESIPNSLTSLSFYGYYIDEIRITNFVRQPMAQQLHTLVIEGGRYVTNTGMQIMITTLPQLEVFGVNDSRYLTDAGVTGLPEESCKQIIYCNQRSILSKAPLDTNSLTGVPINRMTKLRKLSLAGCRKISDISVLVAIKFPLLEEVNLSRCLNVTDVGLVSLAQNNPSLERIIVMKNLKITHLGLNLVLQANDSIANIHTSKGVRKRDLGKQVPYETSYRYDTAVTYARWDERRARPMYTE